MLTRRDWILAAAAAATNSTRIWGAQLSTLRGAVRREPTRVLKALAAIGFREVEGAARPDALAMLPAIRDAGLSLRGCYVETPLVTADWERYANLVPVPLEEAIGSLKQAGVEYFVVRYIEPGARGDGDDFYRRTADRMNRAGELCHKAGLKLTYHNHSFEFSGRPGLRPIDIFRERLDGKLALLELDVFWASVAGQDPLEIIRTWKGRLGPLHLGDLAKGFRPQTDESILPGVSVELGTGTVALSAILKAAAAAGVRSYFVDQEEAPGDGLDSLRKSFDYLRSV